MPRAKRARNLRKHEALGQLFAERRKAKRMTQAQLAKLLRRPQSFVSNVEAGQHRVDLLELLDFAEALGFDPPRFLREFQDELSSL